MSQSKLWSLLTALVVALIAIGGWFIGISPERAKANRISDEASQQQDANATLRTQIETLKAQEPDLPKQQARLEEIDQKLPSDPQQPRLIRALDSAAGRSGVLLFSVAAAPPAAVVGQTPPPAAAPSAEGESKDGAQGADAQPQDSTAAPNPAAQPTAAGLEQIVLTITVYGDYAQITQYLNELESMDRALVVEGLSLAPGDPPRPEGAPTVDERDRWKTLSATITARVFMAPPVAVVPTTPPANAAKS